MIGPRPPRGFRAARDRGLTATLAATALAASFALHPGPTIAAPAGQAAAPTAGQAGDPFPSLESIPGWTRTEAPMRYDRGGLYGYINGGAELFLQYGFKAAMVQRFGPDERRPGGATAAAPPEREITLELYLMDSPENAFGIFSVKRDGGEPVSPRIAALNWTSPAQLSFVRGAFFVNVLGDGTSEEDLIGLAAAVADTIQGDPAPRVPELSWLPQEGKVPGSERYIRGDIAAVNESPLLGAEFWGFGSGEARAFAAKYGRVNARVVIVDFGQPREDLSGQVFALFQEYLADVRLEDGLVSGANAAGYHFLFRQSGATAALVMGEPDLETALRRLDQAEHAWAVYQEAGCCASSPPGG